MGHMKISELVGSLEKIRECHGDLDIRLLNDSGPLLGSVKVRIEESSTRTLYVYVVLSDLLRLSPDRN